MDVEATAKSEQPVAGKSDKTEESTEQPQKQPGIGEMLTSPMFMGLIVVWLLVLWSMRKNKKKTQNRKEELNQISKGDNIVTIGRVHGEVVSVTDETFTIKTDKKSDATITFGREALLKVIPRGGYIDNK